MANATFGSAISSTAQIGDGVIVDADINASAAIAYSKLALTASIVNADIAAAAAIAITKLAAGTQGDILYAGAAGVWSKLPAGTSGFALISGGAGANPSWGAASVPSVVGAHITRSSTSTQNLDNTFTTTFQPGTIVITGILKGCAGGVAKYSQFVSFWSGTTIKTTLYDYKAISASVNLTDSQPSWDDAALDSGVQPDNSSNNTVVVSVLSVGATSFVIRCAFTGTNGVGAQADYIATATP